MKIARNERGFTLIELMVVLIIIGILAAIAIPVMSKQTDKAKVKRAIGELKSMKTIVDIYMVDTSVNPDGVAPLLDDATAEPIAGIKAVLTTGGASVFEDPWGNPYYYTRAADGTGYTIFSEGSSAADDSITVTNDANPTESESNTHAATDWNLKTDALAS